jgi:catechol-2,3-dioxygenase
VNIDALAEKFYPVSPYIYAINNPVYFVDPDGNDIKIVDNRYSYEKDRDYDKYEEGFGRDHIWP